MSMAESAGCSPSNVLREDRLEYDEVRNVGTLRFPSLPCLYNLENLSFEASRMMLSLCPDSARRSSLVKCFRWTLSGSARNH